MSITINSNGSGKIQPLENLFKLLEIEPLDPSFEKFGNFYEQFPEMADGSKSEVENYFFGNFFNVSHVFQIEINDDYETADKLLAAIQQNQKTDAYLAAKKARYG